MNEEEKSGKKSTIKDIANMAGTSKTTVSFYLNGKFDKMSDETKKKIEKIIEKTGYKPSMVARSLSSKRSNLIGVLVGDISSYLGRNLIVGIEKVLKQNDFQMTIGSTNFSYKDEKEYVEKMINLGVDGFIVQPSINFSSLIETIEDNGKKIILVDSINNNYKGRWVQADNFYVTKKSIEKLISKKFDNFILITEEPSVLEIRMDIKMAFEVTCADNDVNYSTLVIDKDIDLDNLNNRLKNLFRYDGKNVLFCANGQISKVVFDSMKKFSTNMFSKSTIVGFDRCDWTMYTTPRISTIEQQNFEAGKYATELLIEAINGTIRKPSKVFECDIEWSESIEIAKKGSK